MHEAQDVLLLLLVARTATKLNMGRGRLQIDLYEGGMRSERSGYLYPGKSEACLVGISAKL